MIATIKEPNITADIPKGILTIEQIKEIVGDGWAIFKNPVGDRKTTRGELLFYTHDEEEAYEQFSVLRKEHYVYFTYCGKRDPNVVYLL